MDFSQQIRRAIELAGAADPAERERIYERARTVFHARMAELGVPGEAKAGKFNELANAIAVVEREMAAQEAASRFTLSAEDILGNEAGGVQAGNQQAGSAKKTVKVGLFEVEEGSQAHRELNAQQKMQTPESGVTAAEQPIPEQKTGGSIRGFMEMATFLVALASGFVVAGAAFARFGDALSFELLSGAAVFALVLYLGFWLAEIPFGFRSIADLDSNSGVAVILLVLSLGTGLIWQGAREAEKASYQLVAPFLPDVGLSNIPGISGLLGRGNASDGAIVYSRWETLEPEPFAPDAIVMDDLK